MLAWQVWVARHALKAQTRANELQVFTTMNATFLELISVFKEHINERDILVSDLEPEERRAIDRWFYLASSEYVMYKEQVINPTLANQWIKGIELAASRKVFVERWCETASKFTLDEGFREFFEKSRGRSLP